MLEVSGKWIIPQNFVIPPVIFSFRDQRVDKQLA
jgi:hypothetical protein